MADRAPASGGCAVEVEKQMKLKEQLDALKYLSPGWNGDKQFPAPAINRKTIALAKRLLAKFLNEKWRVMPLPDGAIRFSLYTRSTISSITVGAL